MAEHNRQTTRKSAPISRHPLFPAIVALWFGALFGLGSLAVRPSLLEELVLAGQIDTIIPAAAPPLGLTARILLALGMALLGGVTGATIARRIARPKPVVRQRRRGAASGDGARGYGHASAGYDLDDDDDDEDVAPVPANKRRSLAMSEEETPLELREYAPLPGSGAPQILNLSDVAAEPIRSGPAPSHALALDEAADADSPGPEPETAWTRPAAPRQQPHEAIARLERTFAGGNFDAAPVHAPPPGEAARRFDRGDARIEPEPAFVPAAVQSFSNSETARPFAQPVTGEAFVAAPAAAAVTGPGFAPPAAQAAEPEAPEAVQAEAPARSPITLAQHVPLFREPEPVAAEFTEEFAEDDEAEAARPAATAEPEAPPAADVAAKPAFVLPGGTAARQLAEAELDGLSPVQLVERLALSIQRRRDRAETGAAPAPATVARADTAPPKVEPPKVELPAAVERFAPIHVAAAAPTAPAPGIAPAPMAMPAALRPVSLAGADDDDFELDSLSLPPRFVATKVPAAVAEPEAPAPEPVAEPVAASAEPSDDVREPDEQDDETRVLADGYSSLLDLSRPAGQRPQFVRIEEPEDVSDVVEPVVVFPSHATRTATPAPLGAQPAPFAAPAARQAAPEATVAAPARRFDSPPAGASAMQQAGDRDAEEAERALRAALATLQRMSAAS